MKYLMSLLLPTMLALPAAAQTATKWSSWNGRDVVSTSRADGCPEGKIHFQTLNGEASLSIGANVHFDWNTSEQATTEKEEVPGDCVHTFVSTGSDATARVETTRERCKQKNFNGVMIEGARLTEAATIAYHREIRDAEGKTSSKILCTLKAVRR